MTTEALRQLGFTQVGEPGNDEAYPAGNAGCHGQIRYGPAGHSAARTLQLVEPCLQLVNDGRPDASVDLSVGEAFNDVRPSSEAREILGQLQAASAQNVSASGNEQHISGRAPIVDQELLADTMPSHC